tara:strand:+ start:135 stop:512 length:378 start_codon:yes stop_codon:yes gene_type:complete
MISTYVDETHSSDDAINDIFRKKEGNAGLMPLWRRRANSGTIMPDQRCYAMVHKRYDLFVVFYPHASKCFTMSALDEFISDYYPANDAARDSIALTCARLPAVREMLDQASLASTGHAPSRKGKS